MASADFNLDMNDMDLMNLDILWPNDNVDDLLLTIDQSNLLPANETNSNNEEPGENTTKSPNNATEQDSDSKENETNPRNEEPGENTTESPNKATEQDSDSEHEVPQKKMKQTKQSLHDYVQGSKNKNTTDKTRRDTNRFKDYVLLEREMREIQDIPPPELNIYLGDFIKGLKQKNGKEYEPDSISSFYRYFYYSINSKKMNRNTHKRHIKYTSINTSIKIPLPMIYSINIFNEITINYLLINNIQVNIHFIQGKLSFISHIFSEASTVTSQITVIRLQSPRTMHLSWQEVFLYPSANFLKQRDMETKKIELNHFRPVKKIVFGRKKQWDLMAQCHC